MNCSALSTLVHEFLDGELPPRQRAAFEARLAVCTRCRDLVAAERKATGHIRALMRGTATPHWLGARISAALAAEATVVPGARERRPGTGWH